MRPPGERPADRRKGDPAGHQQAGGWHLPEEAVGDVQQLHAFVVAERRQTVGDVDAGEALVVEGAAGRRHDGMAGAIDDEAIAKVQDGAAFVPPGATAPDAIGAEHAHGSLLREQRRDSRRPINAGLAGVDGLPIGQLREREQVG